MGRGAASSAVAWCGLLLGWCGRASAQCPNACSGKGACDVYGTCACFRGWTAADCGERTCPESYAWADAASATDTAHAKAECSNRGACNRATGDCECAPGFTGRACEAMRCDFDCVNKGKCLSMRRLAMTQYSDESEKFTYEAPWDADKVPAAESRERDLSSLSRGRSRKEGRGGLRIRGPLEVSEIDPSPRSQVHGCVCDKPYDASFNCGKRSCPSGDDPLTLGQVNEVQVLTCMATAGSFALLLRGEPTATIRAGANLAQFSAALEASEAIDAVAVSSATGVSGARPRR